MTFRAAEPDQETNAHASMSGPSGLVDRFWRTLRDPGWPLSLTWLRSLLTWRLLRVWVVLGLWTVAWGAYSIRNGLMGSWGIFPNAARILLAGGDYGGFHLYFVRPDYQFGPVATLVALPLAHLPLLTSKWVAGVLMTVCGLWLVAVISGFSARGVGLPKPGAVGLGGLLVMPVWASLSLSTGHLDDVLALGFGLFGILQVRRGRPIWSAVFFALAADSKPWAVAFAVAVLALPKPQWFRTFVVWAGLILVAWLPFFIIEPRTVAAMKYKLVVAPNSVLTLLHVSGLHMPWYRPAQLILALTVGILLARAGAPQAVLLATVASRLMFEPEVATYYTAGAVLVAFLVDRSRGREMPWFTLAALALLWLPQLIEEPAEPMLAAPWLRLIWAVGTLVGLVVTFLRGGSASSDPDSSRRDTAVLASRTGTVDAGGMPVLRSRLLLSVALGCIAAVSLSGCGGTSPGPSTQTPVSPTTTAASPSSTPTAAASPSSTPTAPVQPGSSSPTPAGAQNLKITNAVRAQLVAAGAKEKSLVASDFLGLRKGLTYYAFDPVTNTYWAGASLDPKSSSMGAQVSVQDDGAYTLFHRSAAGSWSAMDSALAAPNGPTGATPCGLTPPADVLALWGWPAHSCHPTGE